MAEFDFMGYEKDSEQNNRNSVDLSSKDDIELVKEEENTEISEDISDIRKDVMSIQQTEEPKEEVTPVEPVQEVQPTVVPTEPVQEVQPTAVPTEPVQEVKPVQTVQPAPAPVVEQQNVVKTSNVNVNVEDADNAYKAYLSIVAKLPSGLLDDLNLSYMTLERSISAVPKDILLKFVKEFETIKEELPGIYLNQNDFGRSNYSFIIEKLKIYYDFFTTVPYQMINNLLVSYDEYAKYYKMIPNGCFDDLLYSYKNCKSEISKLPNDLVKSLGYDKINSVFLDRVLLYQESENLLLSNARKGDIFNNEKYSIANDNKFSTHIINVPVMTKDDFINLTSSLGNIDKANEICRNNIGIIYKSVSRVDDTLRNDIVLLNNLISNMELSPMFLGLDDSKKKNIMYMLSDQLSKRVYLESKMSQDLKYGWNQLEGNLGSGLDVDYYDDSDCFTKYMNISEIALEYNKYFEELLPLLQIIDKIREYGYVIN